MISQLHYITQSNPNISHLQAVENALKSGCKWIQLRIKDPPLDSVLETALKARQLCNAHQAKLIINDYPEIALAVEADGLHLGLLDTSISEARKIVGNKMIIGGTANTLGDVLKRVKERADYVGLGPFRFTNTKKKLSPILGIDGYRTILTEIKKMNINIPIIAIGGIELADVAMIIDTGVYGIAVSGAITYAANREVAVTEILQKLENSRQLKYS